MQAYVCANQPPSPFPACRLCNQVFLDSGNLDMFPKGIQRLVPVEMSDKSGLGVGMTQQLATLPSQGVPIFALSKSFNELLLNSHYSRESSFYTYMDRSLRRQLPIQQVCRGKGRGVQCSCSGTCMWGVMLTLLAFGSAGGVLVP